MLDPCNLRAIGSSKRFVRLETFPIRQKLPDWLAYQIIEAVYLPSGPRITPTKLINTHLNHILINVGTALAYY